MAPVPASIVGVVGFGNRRGVCRPIGFKNLLREEGILMLETRQIGAALEAFVWIQGRSYLVMNIHSE
jgi:hypothetical protein